MTAEKGPQTKLLEIRKYPNRRYYDASRSQHLTLEEIHSLIREGYDVRVTDSKTGADITGQVLTQIILELDTPKLDSLPAPLLMRLIRLNDRMIKEFIEKYFHQALNAFVEYQQQLEQRWRQMQGMNPFSAWAPNLMPGFGQAFETTPQEKAPPASPASAEAQDPAELRELVKELQRQVSGLEQELRKEKPKAKRGKR